MVDWLSLAVPLAYLGVLIGSLATFSSLYRKRKARTSLPPSCISLPSLLQTLLPNQPANKQQKKPPPSNHGSPLTSNATSTSPSSTSTQKKAKRALRSLNPCSRPRSSDVQPKTLIGFLRCVTRNRRLRCSCNAGVSAMICGSGF